jgi:hypothetical protein
MARISKVLLLLATLPLSMACLPDDFRPPPGRIVVRVAGDDELHEGLVATDGWDIAFERFELSLGQVWLDRAPEGARCDPYSESLYLRILDLLRPGPHTLSTLYARGDCAIRVQMRGPGTETKTVLATDVDEEVERHFRTFDSDVLVEDAPVALHVVGNASRSDAAVSFDWSFRQAFDYELCQSIRFEGGTADIFDIVVHSRLLFRDRPDAENVELRFEHFAAADANGDGDITLDELARAPADGAPEFETLAELLYFELAPRLLSFEGRPACFFGKLSER